LLILAAFTAIALLTAGTFAALKGDTFVFAGLLVVLLLTMLVAVPLVPAFLGVVQQALDAGLPTALR
jgi:hypothetical protein